MMKSKKNVVFAVGSLALLGVLVWGWMRYREEARLQTVRDLAEKAMQVEGDQRREAWQQVREASEQLSESARQSLQQEGMQKMMAERMQRIDSFLALDTKQARDEFLDEEIREMEERRKEWEQRRRERDNEAAQGGGPGRGENAGNGERRGGPGPGGPGGPGGRGGRDQWVSRIYDNTTPDQRAKYTAYREAVQRRRDELGMPEMTWGGPGRGGRR